MVLRCLLVHVARCAGTFGRSRSGSEANRSFQGAAAVTAFCVKCWSLVTFQQTLPARCTCGGQKWRTVSTRCDEPTKPYQLSENDKRLLRQMRIAAEP